MWRGYTHTSFELSLARIHSNRHMRAKKHVMHDIDTQVPPKITKSMQNDANETLQTLIALILVKSLLLCIH